MRNPAANAVAAQIVHWDKCAEKLGRLNGMAENMDAESYEAMLHRIESEIFADAFGNINYFRLGADRYTDAARETVNETIGRETAAATERRTGPPTQFSEGEERRRQSGSNRITENDIQELRSVGRKSVNSFTSEDIQKAEKWARIYEKDLKTKSPFFRAWFGDWRANDIAPVSVADIPEYTPTNEFRKANRGTYKNADTKWDITVSREGETNTISHAGEERLSEYGLAGIKALVENAVLLDTEVHEHHDNNAVNDNIAFDHKLYALGQNADGIALYKVTIEEYFQDKNHPDKKRFHNLRYIEKVADIPGGRTYGKNRSGGSTDGESTTKYTVADIYEYVKNYDGEFTKGSGVNPAMLEEDGTPKLFYHGTEADFTVFDRTKGRSTMDIQGSFFSPWELDAEGYGSKVGAYYLNLKNPAPEGVAYRALNRFKGQNNAGIKARKYLESLGYDGVNNSDEEFIAFNPEQIKSATDNMGTYDRSNPDTLFSMSEDENIPESAAEYSRQRYREENREPQSAAEYSQMKQRALEREAEIRKLEKKGEASAEDRREAAWARREFEAPKEKANKQQATIAKKDLRNTIISEFGIPDGRKAEIGKLIDAYADRAYKDGKLTETDRAALFNKLYSEGVMTVPADDAFQAAREIIKGGRVYIPESVKHEFGDDWGSFRRDRNHKRTPGNR